MYNNDEQEKNNHQIETPTQHSTSGFVKEIRNRNTEISKLKMSNDVILSKLEKIEEDLRDAKNRQEENKHDINVALSETKALVETRKFLEKELERLHDVDNKQDERNKERFDELNIKINKTNEELSSIKKNQDSLNEKMDKNSFQNIKLLEKQEELFNKIIERDKKDDERDERDKDRKFKYWQLILTLIVGSLLPLFLELLKVLSK